MTGGPTDGTLTATVSHPELLDGLRSGAGVPAGVRLVHWDMTAPLTAVDPREVHLAVVPHYATSRRTYELLHDLPNLRVVQLPSAGFEHALPRVPAGIVLCNGRGVHDAGTAELALALTLASQRGIDDAVRDAAQRAWRPVHRSSLADRRVVVVGAGSIGTAVADRLRAFETEVVRVARTRREDDHGVIHSTDELPDLLPTADVVVLVVPLTDETERLVDGEFLAAMPDGALLVNVARGKVVDTEALLAELTSGRLRAALDVTDPEPLPEDHPLWAAPNLVLTPHVGGATDATTPRLVALLRRQLEALAQGRPPVNEVART